MTHRSAGLRAGGPLVAEHHADHGDFSCPVPDVLRPELRVAGTRLDLGAGGHARDVSNLRGRGTMAGAGGEEGIAMQVQDYVAAVVFGAAIGLLARILLPGRQRIGLILTVLIGMGAAVAGTWAANRYGIHSDHFFVVRGHRYDWLVVGVQVGIGIVGVAIAALLARAFSSDNRDRRQVERH
jgi:uncharacterized membrane protein YeaQ/YmgE (transglycosylase-associated protein family)